MEIIQNINEVKKIDWFDDRFYKYIKQSGEIKYLPSVTTVLSIINKPFLASWRGSVGNVEADRISETAKQKGSKIHAACELIAKGEEVIMVGYDQNEWLQICRYVEFLKIINPKIIDIERTIFDPVLGYAGTADLIFEVSKDNQIKIGTDTIHLVAGQYLLDIKTGSSINEFEYFMQLSAYFFGLKIEDKINKNLTGAFILHLNAKNKIGYKIYFKTKEELEVDFSAFKNCLNLFNRKSLKIEPKILELPESLRWKQEETLYSYLWVEPNEAEEVPKKIKVKKQKSTKSTKSKTKKIKETKNELLQS